MTPLNAMMVLSFRSLDYFWVHVVGYLGDVLVHTVRCIIQLLFGATSMGFQCLFSVSWIVSLVKDRL